MNDGETIARENAVAPERQASPARVMLLGAGPLPSPESPHAPGVANRLWNFLQPSLVAGHDCLVLTLEEGAESYREGMRPVEKKWDDVTWRHLALPTRDFQKAEKLTGIVKAFQPTAIASAGTLLTAAAACEIAGDTPVWVDLFGDPLAEVQAKYAVNAATFNVDDHLLVWELMVKVLMRGDAFSTVSRRQKDALLGQLLLLGMRDGDEGGVELLSDLIHSIPCGMESFAEPPEGRLDPPKREAMLSQIGLPADAQIVLCSGGFNTWSDPGTLVSGVEFAMRELPQLCLVATGGSLPGYFSDAYQSFQDLVESSPFRERIKLLGWLPLEQAEAWPLAADAAVMVDRPCSETRLGARNRLLPLAAACCPTIATRGTEVVEEMEAAGALLACDPDDPEALASLIVQAITNIEASASMAVRNTTFCEKNYRFDVTAAPFLEFIECAQRGYFKLTRDELAPTTASLVATQLDPQSRRAEWTELAHYRSGRWSRIRRWMQEKMG